MNSTTKDVEFYFHPIITLFLNYYNCGVLEIVKILIAITVKLG